jgi:hypothetical protein
MFPQHARLHLGAFTHPKLWKDRLDQVAYWTKPVYGKDFSAVRKAN